MSRVVLTGMGAESAAGHGVSALLGALAQGRCVLAQDEEMHALGFRCTLAGRLHGVQEMFAQKSGLEKAEQRYFCRFSQIGYLAAREALLQSGLVDEQLCPRSQQARVQVFVGSGIGPVGEVAEQIRSTYARKRPPSPGHAVPRVMPSFLPAFFSQRLGASRGGAMISLACNSGLLAIMQGAEAIARGEIDWCLAGGVEEDHVCTWASFDAMRALPKTGPDADVAMASRPFSASAYGFIPAGAAAFVVLESEQHARTREARTLGALRGWCHRLGIANGGAITALDGAAYAYAIGEALDMAQLSPRDVAITLPHAHSSPADIEELSALAGVLPLQEGASYVSVPKAHLGHSIGASGVLDVIAMVAQLRRGEVFANPIPEDLHERLHELRSALEPAAFDKARKGRIGLKTGHAFGRSNAAILIEAERG